MLAELSGQNQEKITIHEKLQDIATSGSVGKEDPVDPLRASDDVGHECIAFGRFHFRLDPVIGHVTSTEMKL